MDNEQFNRWTRICELVISVALPVAIGVAGYFIQLRLTEMHAHNAVMKVTVTQLADRRQMVNDQTKHLLNDIYSYIEDVGGGEKLSVAEIRERRHRLHNIMYANRALWSPETFSLYLHYMDKTAFRLSPGMSPSLIRTLKRPGKDDSGPALADNDWLTGERDICHREYYHRLQNAMTSDLLLRDITRGGYCLFLSRYSP